MTAVIPQVTEETGLAGVIASFLSSGEHRVIVVDGQGRPVGMISDSDVVGRIQPAHRRGILGAARWGVCCPADRHLCAGVDVAWGGNHLVETSVVEAVRRMVSAQRKWLVVVDEVGNRSV